MTPKTWKVAALLFFSGFSALVYQTVWLRQFRLIFGTSTWATAAVLAIFMAGLGAGSALLGRRADAKLRPLGWYGRLELLIAVAATLSPLLLAAAARIYFASGGSPELGIGLATLLRLTLAFVILGPATLLMGGTLPAAARSVESEGDGGRRAVALLYGVNTAGAVAGVLLSTFVLLEMFGNQRTLYLAVVVNVAVALIALRMSRAGETEAGVEAAPASAEDAAAAPVPPKFVHAAAAIAGFAFLLMELVWYRMLSPILGGTTYMFGLVLAVALAGIALGGAAYALWFRRRASLGAFAITMALEAIAIAIPFALGDRIAYLANALRGLGALGFDGHVAGWALVSVIVVFPAAFISGVQFPLLISLLGSGREDVGRHIGTAYAWNTAGAIAGSLAGGFGLLPLLSAPTVWRLVVVLLALVAIGASLFAFQRGHRHARGSALASLLIAFVAFGAVAAEGPTAVWRHGGIGAARAPKPVGRNELLRWSNETKRNVLWERDGRESSVALMTANDLAFVVNGKSDGAARGDAETQVMLGVIPAMLHPNPRTALVIGLGTGESAGWLAAIPSMERVDVVELEPVVVDVARECAPLNANALANPKMQLIIGDAREVLLTSSRKWDVIASEPSNPYRAGIASLLTREFYVAARERLAPGGYLAQWVQSYSIHSATMQTVYATLLSVFPHVQTWWTTAGDLVLVASADPIVIDANSVGARLRTPGFGDAVFNAWRITQPESFLARMFANENFARAAAAEAAELNTDDRTVIEFGFARSIDDSGSSIHKQIADGARAHGADHALRVRGRVDRRAIDAARPWNDDPMRPSNHAAYAEAAMRMARSGDARAEKHAAQLRQRLPVEADMILAALRAKQGRDAEAVALIVGALDKYRRDAWPHPDLMLKGLEVALDLAKKDPRFAASLYAAIERPFAVRQLESARKGLRITIAPLFDECGAKTLGSLNAIEPHPIWTREMLTIRANCYAIANDPRAENAWRDLETFTAAESSPLVTKPAPRSPRGSS